MQPAMPLILQPDESVNFLWRLRRFFSKFQPMVKAVVHVAPRDDGVEGRERRGGAFQRAVL